MSELIWCPDCAGIGRIYQIVCEKGNGCFDRERLCPRCGGEGHITESQQMLIESGRLLRAARIARGESQTAAATRLGMSVVQYSHLENGRMP